jgi:hypothetical protein
MQRQKMECIMRYGWAVVVFILSSAAGAAEVGSCDGLDRIGWLASPLQSYSGGKVRIALVDTDGEPVCCSSHLLVFIPSEPIGSQCFAVSQTASKEAGGQRGFSNIEFKQIKASYDSNRGLLLTVPYSLYEQPKPRSVKVRVDLRNEGSVKIEP